MQGGVSDAVRTRLQDIALPRTLLPYGSRSKTRRKRLVGERLGMTAGRNNAEVLSQHWCTPPKYVNAIREFFAE